MPSIAGSFAEFKVKSENNAQAIFEGLYGKPNELPSFVAVKCYKPIKLLANSLSPFHRVLAINCNMMLYKAEFCSNDCGPNKSIMKAISKLSAGLPNGRPERKITDSPREYQVLVDRIYFDGFFVPYVGEESNYVTLFSELLAILVIILLFFVRKQAYNERLSELHATCNFGLLK
ncbi:hypothetical protein ACU8KH_02549 [Lachancea thermotolerans]